jgi:hypothetical protein
MMNLPCVFIWITGLVFVIFSANGRTYSLFGWTYLCVIVSLVLLHGKDYYSLGAYPVLFAFGAFYLERLTQLKFKWIRYAMLAFSLGLGLFSLPLVMPVAKPERLAKYYSVTGLNKTGDFKWEDLKYHPLPQDFGDMIGWKEMAIKAGTVYNNMPPKEREKTMVFCSGYYSAGALNFYRKEANLPEVYSTNASFLFWLPEKYDIRNIIYVARKIPDSTDRFFRQFEKMTIKDSVNYPLFRENGTHIILFENGSDSLNSIIEYRVAQLKKEFTR